MDLAESEHDGRRADVQRESGGTAHALHLYQVAAVTTASLSPRLPWATTLGSRAGGSSCSA